MTIKLTREEAIQDLKAIKSFERYARGRLALDVAIEALERERTDEWCTDCKEYDTEKKCCPRFNRVIREALKREPNNDGTLEVKVENATKIGRVLISDDKHRGGLYYPDEDEPQGDLIGRAEAIYEIHDFFFELMDKLPITVDEDGEEVITDAKTANALLVYNKMLCKRFDALPSADRPKGEWIEETSWKYKRGGRNSDMKEALGTEWMTMIRQRCSECNKVTMVDGSILYNYCPHCGADMRGDTK